MTAHGHSHGLVDPSITRSRAGLRVVAASLGVLALTAVPLGAAFLLRSARAERVAGVVVVLAILVSAITAAVSPRTSSAAPTARRPARERLTDGSTSPWLWPCAWRWARAWSAMPA